MKRFLSGIGISSVIVFLILFISDYIVTTGLRKTDYSTFAKVNKVFSGSIDSEILILGGSDAAQHFSPIILDSLLEKKCYNLGLPGHNFFMQYALFEQYLKERNNKYPEVIIHAVNVNFLSQRKDFYAYRSFLPYLKKDGLWNYIKRYNGVSYFDYLIPFVRYSGDLELIKVGCLEFFGLEKYKNDLYRGYKAYDHQWDEASLEAYTKLFPRERKPDSLLLDMFDAYLSDAKANGTKVVLVQSPFLREARQVNINWDSYTGLYREYAEKYDFTFLDYSQDSLSTRKEHFYDYAHLRNVYSKVFTRHFAQDVVKVL